MSNIRFRFIVWPLALASCALALVPPPASAEEAPPPAGVRGEILVWIEEAEGKLIELSEAMPAGKYTWSPGKGVRTVADVYMHVATANFGLPGFIGVQAPEGFRFETFEKSKTKKEEIVQTLKDSFAHVKGALRNTSDEDLERPAEFFGMKTTARGAYLLLLSHAHEHLGQAIAYARMNGVTPPWTAREEAASREKKTKSE
jgi:uncharacterized damage-inducible protein DinB